MISNKQTFLWTAPYVLCWLSVPIIILLGLLFRKDTIDFQLYDTYYVITVAQYATALAILLWFFGMVYWLLDKAGKKPNYLFFLLHLVTTVLILTIVATPSLSIVNPFILLVVFAVAQLAFIANVSFSLLRRQ